MNRKGLIVLAVSVLLLLEAEVSGQSFYAIRKQRDLILTVGAGTATHFSDFQDPGDYIDAKPSINVGAQIYPFPRFFENRISARAELTWFNLKGEDSKANDSRVVRNLSFTSNNWELNTVGIVNLIGEDQRYANRSVFNVYGLIGIGVMYMNPKTEYQGEKYALQPLQTEGVEYSKFQFVIPYGLGFKFKPSPLYNIAIEGVWRKTFTDYMDDVSGRFYPDPASLSSDLSRALADRRLERDPNYPILPNQIRGNPDKKDSYMLVNVKLEYYLPIQLQKNKLMTVPKRKYRRR
jgi:hypothetical protein